jgi:hypothetical protein
VLLSEAVAPLRRLAIVGLAKNAGKTEALAALLREHEAAGVIVGVTSIGNDGEQRDAIDERIEKPRIGLAAGSLVATTDLLLRRADAAVEILRRTPHRTPLGRVVIGRVGAPGTLEVAGPVAAEDVGAVGEEMIALGAERVLIDGALDRRASAAPAVADGVVVSTGAVLGVDMEQVVARTRDAIELLQLPRLEHPGLRNLARSLRDSTLVIAGDTAPAGSGEARRAAAAPSAALIPLPRRLALDGPVEDVLTLLREHPRARGAIIRGALCEPLLEGVVRARRAEGFRIVVEDARCVFLTRRSVRWYAARGLALEVLEPIELGAITVNPVAPLAHRFDPLSFRDAVEQIAPNVPVFDVLHPSYRGAAGADAQKSSPSSATVASP